MKSRCKFRVTSVHHSTDNQSSSLSAEAVTTGSKENEEFFAATPSGHLSLGVAKSSSLGDLKEGDEFYLTLEKAEVSVGAETASDL